MRLLDIIREVLLYAVWAVVAIGFLLYLMWMLSMIADCVHIM